MSRRSTLVAAFAVAAVGALPAAALAQAPVAPAPAAPGVIAAGVIMWATEWYYADPLFSAGIGVFILPRTWTLVREAVGVLLEGTPSDVSIAAVRDAIAQVPGVVAVHDIHVWTLTSGVNAMSAHAVLASGAVYDDVLRNVQARVTATFNIGHATIQIEPVGHEEGEAHL